MFKHSLAKSFIFLLLVFILGWFAGKRFNRSPGLAPKFQNTATIIKQVQTLSQLVTVKYVMEKVEILADPPQNPIRAALPDNTHVTLIAHGVVKAGVDLSQLKAEHVQISGKKVLLSLPSPQITDAYLDEKLTQVVERNTGFLRSFNKDLEQTARQNAVDDIRRAARTHGILKDAEDRARAQLSHLCTQLGFEQVEFGKQ